MEGRSVLSLTLVYIIFLPASRTQGTAATGAIFSLSEKKELGNPGSRTNLFRILDPGVKKAPDPGSGSATLTRERVKEVTQGRYEGWVGGGVGGGHGG